LIGPNYVSESRLDPLDEGFRQNFLDAAQ
jgi:hypothetical protein